MPKFMTVDNDNVVNVEEISYVRRYTSRGLEIKTDNHEVIPLNEKFNVSIHLVHGGSIELSSEDADYMDAIYEDIKAQNEPKGKYERSTSFHF